MDPLITQFVLLHSPRTNAGAASHLADTVEGHPYTAHHFIHDSARVAALTVTTVRPFARISAVTPDGRLVEYDIDCPERVYFFGKSALLQAIARYERYRAVRDVFDLHHHTMRASHLLWCDRFGEYRVDGPMLRELCSLPVKRTAPGFFEVVDAAAMVEARAAEVQAGRDLSSGLRVELPRLGEDWEY